MEGRPFEVWFKLHGRTLNTGKRKVEGEKDMAELMKSRDQDDVINLYITEVEESSKVPSPHEVGSRCQKSIFQSKSVSLIMDQRPTTPVSTQSHCEQHLTPNSPSQLIFQFQSQPKDKFPQKTRKEKPTKLQVRRKDTTTENEKTVEWNADLYELDGNWSDESNGIEIDVEFNEGDEDYENEDFMFGKNGSSTIITDEAEENFKDNSEEGVCEANNEEEIVFEQVREANIFEIEQDPPLLFVDELDVEVGNEVAYDSDDLRNMEVPNKGVDPYPTFNPNVDFGRKIDLILGLKFPSNKVLRLALVQHAIENGYEFYYQHNGSARLTTLCRHKCECEWNSKISKFGECICKAKRKCKFKVYATKLDEDGTFQVKSLNLEHVCGYRNQNRMLSSEFLANKYLEVWRQDPQWKLEALKTRVLMDLGVDVGYHKCWLARARAKLIIFGNGNDQYARIWDYAEALKKYNPGSSAFVMISQIDRPPPLFQRVYICLQACKEGFLKGCRPIIGVDGCHLKGPYPGMCLVAVAKDGNNNIFPVAWGVVEVENASSWQWFLSLLITDLEKVEGEGLTFMSDRQKGLIDAFKEVTPKAEIRYCVRHIWANFKLQFSGQAYKEGFWNAAYATTESEFKSELEGIKSLSEPAYAYLKGIPPKHWSRHAFTTQSKSSMLLNNLCETFNAVIKDARDKPILTHMEWMRRYVMKRSYEKISGVEKYGERLMPYVDKYLEKVGKETRYCIISPSKAGYEVEYKGDTCTVKLDKNACSCYLWDLTGIPCTHAMACIMKQRHVPEDYVDEAYTRDKYILAYTPAINPMPGVRHWEKTSHPQPLPPAYRKMPGRPSSKKRRKEPGEGENKFVKRAKKNNKCSRCGALGHNVKTCQNPPAAPKSPKKRGRPPTDSTWVKNARMKATGRRAANIGAQQINQPSTQSHL
ncbi:uncharacterized protein LOC141626881 [Silene latifolia]|uniref:uncharacterized protein LOC141626881 n=1 Tax=Silene latifolia TaxID=37657 RepID=UPI003D77C122